MGIRSAEIWLSGEVSVVACLADAKPPLKRGRKEVEVGHFFLLAVCDGFYLRAAGTIFPGRALHAPFIEELIAHFEIDPNKGGLLFKPQRRTSCMDDDLIGTPLGRLPVQDISQFGLK
jgi:hypothetical protein